MKLFKNRLKTKVIILLVCMEILAIFGIGLQCIKIWDTINFIVKARLKLMKQLVWD